LPKRVHRVLEYAFVVHCSGALDSGRKASFAVAALT
jgi:hypothetical protein